MGRKIDVFIMRTHYVRRNKKKEEEKMYKELVG
jgi:hypothetical protein